MLSFPLQAIEEYTGHANLWLFTVAANPRSKNSLMERSKITTRTDQPTFSLVFFSLLVECHQGRGVE